MKLSMKKDDNGIWNIDEPGELPGWVNEISLSIVGAIEDNESAPVTQ